MKCLVTGAAGFIGSHIVDELISQGLDVIGVDNLAFGDRSNVNPQSRFRVADKVGSTRNTVGKAFSKRSHRPS